MTGVAPLHTVAVAGLSVRPLAQSARRAGWRVVALDGFGDRDTRAAGLDWRALGSGLASPGVAALREALAWARQRHGAQAWVAGAGFDGRLGLLRAGNQELPLLGMAPELNVRLRDPATFFGALAACGVPHPPTQWLLPPANPRGWLQKDLRQCGGWHIRPARAAGRPRPGRCWQQQVPGRPMSVLFLADGRRALRVGLNHLRVAPLAGRPFVYQGAVGPVQHPALAAALDAALTRLVPHLGLRGLASLDLMAGEAGRWWALELNPRPSATLALHDAAWPAGLLAAHAQALQGELPAQAPLGACRGEAIVFSPVALRVSSALSDALAALGCADLPRPGQAIAAGAPLCSARAQARGPQAVERVLGHAVATVCTLADRHALEVATP